METQKLGVRPDEESIPVDGDPVSRGSVLDQLERLVESRHFRNSKRYPSFLRFVVEQTLAGSPESLKERNLGVEVFARSSNYDTNADPIVRVTAGEIRKRIAQYYQEAGHEHELRIDLPLGTYVPHFSAEGARASEPKEWPRHEGLLSSASEPRSSANDAVPWLVPEVVVGADAAKGSAVPQTSRARRSRLGWASGFVLCVALPALGWMLHARRSAAGLNYVWQAVLAAPAPATIVIGIHSLNRQGKEEQVESHALDKEDEPADMLSAMVRTDMVPISDLISYSHVSDLLTSHRHAYTTMGSADATLEQLRKGPLVLVGGLDNLWTLRMTSGLRYGFLANGTSESAIVDHQHPETIWRFDNMQHAIVNTVDYAIVASYFDSTIDQPVVIVAGIGKTGTQVAAEFLTSNQELTAWLKQARVPANKNVELVLSTEILDGEAGPPRVVASTTW